MQLINSISTGVGRAIDWTVDSPWGLSYWHSIPSALWDSRIRQVITSTLLASFPAYFIAFADPDNPSELTKLVHKRYNKVASDRATPTDFKKTPSLLIFFFLSTQSWLWETKFLSTPLNGALLKTILANSTVTTLDCFFITPFFKTWKKPSQTRSGFAFTWLLFRCADIGLSFGNASHGLVRLDFDPTLGMARRLAFWAPN